MTTARTPSSSATPVTAARRSCPSCAFHAFSVSGRLSSMVAAAPSRWTLTVSYSDMAATYPLPHASTWVDTRMSSTYVDAMAAQQNRDPAGAVDSTHSHVGLGRVASLRNLLGRLQQPHVANARDRGGSWHE